MRLSAAAVAALIANALAIPDRIQQLNALGKIGGYRSRGKGRGTPSRRYGQNRSRYMPHQGEREMARRRKQMARHGGSNVRDA